jgi:integrase
LEIINEAMGNYEYAFAGRFGDAPLSRQAMSGALAGTKMTKNGKRVTRTPGICELLGIAPFTPHDLRRTAATMCGELGLSEAGISLPRPSGEQGRERQAAAIGHEPGL